MRVIKLRSATTRNKESAGGHPNTSLNCPDEDNGLAHACIGKDAPSKQPEIHFSNDRFIFEWQLYAKRYDPKTIDAHLTAIREFERFIGGLRFDRVVPQDIDRYRKSLIERSKMPTHQGGLRRSTIRHRGSHLAAFFRWLCNEVGYRKINRNLADYFLLPKSAISTDLEPPPKPYPTMDQAARMVASMPAETAIERRDRAIVALAFIFGLRAAALISLRGEHLDINEWFLDHDGRTLRAKNGKSFRVYAFPRTDAFRRIVKDWIEERRVCGLDDQDALFPSDIDLRRIDTGDSLTARPVEPMKTSSAVSAAFCAASQVIGCSFTPHSARHALAALGKTLCRTPREGKIWSENLGHSNDQITERHYGKVTEVERGQMIREMDAPIQFTESEKDLMLDYYGHRLLRGTPEFEQARDLARRHEEASEARPR